MVTPPDFTGIILPWEPASYWKAGDYDPVSLVKNLKAQAALADFYDDLGNIQTRVRIDLDVDQRNIGYWVTIPVDVDSSVIDPALLSTQTKEQAAAQAASSQTSQAWTALRRARDRLLAETDYIEVFINNGTVMSHLPTAIQNAITSNSAAWVSWRQALRDLPANTANPRQVVWPTPPSAPVIHFS